MMLDASRAALRNNSGNADAVRSALSASKYAWNKVFLEIGRLEKRGRKVEEATRDAVNSLVPS